MPFTSIPVAPAQALETVVGPATNSLCVLVGADLYYVTIAEVGSTGAGVPPAFLGNLWIMKSTNSGSTWTQVGNVAHSTGNESTISLAVTGTTLRILVRDGASHDLVFWNWDTLTDALLPNSALGPAVVNAASPLSTVANSDGTLLAVYTDGSGDLQAVIYTPGSDSWGSPTLVFSASTVVGLVKEHSTDRSYCFFMVNSGAALGCLTITNPLSLGSVQVVDIPWSQFELGEAYRPGLACINGADAEIVFPFIDPNGNTNPNPGTDLSVNVLNVARAACADNPAFTFEVVSSSAALPAGQFLSSWLGEFVFTAAVISDSGLLWCFFAAINTESAQDPTTQGTLYYSQNTGPGMGWSAPVQVDQTVVPDAFAQFYPVNISPGVFGFLGSSIDAVNFFSAIGNLKYDSLSNFFLSSGSAPPPSPTVSCNNPPAGIVTVPYSHVLTASGGTPPYTFSISAGALPPGLSLAADGTISGTPILAGVFPFTVLVTDSAAQTGTVDCSISISAGRISITLRGVKIRCKPAPEDLEAMLELPSVDRAM